MHSLKYILVFWKTLRKVDPNNNPVFKSMYETHQLKNKWSQDTANFRNDCIESKQSAPVCGWVELT